MLTIIIIIVAVMVAAAIAAMQVSNHNDPELSTFLSCLTIVLWLVAVCCWIALMVGVLAGLGFFR